MPRPRLSQNQNPMHMVWHHDKSIQFRIREVQRNLIPAAGDHLPSVVKPHLAVSNLPESTPAAHGAYCHEICSRLRVIESGQTQRATTGFHDLSCVWGWFFLARLARGSAMADPYLQGRISLLIDSAFSTRGRAGVFTVVRGGGYPLPGGFGAQGRRGSGAHQRAEAARGARRRPRRKSARFL